MSAHAKTLGLDKLATEEKIQLINELWLDVVSETEDDPISKEFAAELQGRVASYAANPENVYTVDQVMEEIRKDLQA
jgi:putative addiction module component (TIGR02574 family)